MRRVARTVVVVTVTAGVLAPATVALAGSGPAFGQHVVDCAQTVGFSATHNPGMHHGAAGWDGMTCPS